MERKKAIFNWSGGKDSALALYDVLQTNHYDITELMTTVNSKYNRISMHGVRNELLHAQGKSIGIPVKEIRLPEMPSMSEYDQKMKEIHTELQKEGITHSIFGDIFLEDLKRYREDQLKKAGLIGYFPLWKKDTKVLIEEFIDLGFKTVVACVNSKLLDKEFTGRVIDRTFLRDLPSDVDPCGENGEFHTFTFDGPIFKHPIRYTLGEIVFREYAAPKDEKDKTPAGFYFRDLIPVH